MSLVNYQNFINATNGIMVHFASENITTPATKIIPTISLDTRSMQFREAFCALKGKQFNGHDFLSTAIKKGASLLIIEHEYASIATELLQQAQYSCDIISVQNTLTAYGILAKLHREHFNLPVVAITGSCGKTSVKQMLSSILQQRFNVLYSKASFNNEVGLPTTLLELTSAHQVLVVEMGARNLGDITYLCELAQPTVTVVNNVAPVHLETFVSLDNIAAEKGRVYLMLAASGTAIINIDDIYAPAWLTLLQQQKIITFGAGNADISCSFISQQQNKLTFELMTDIGNSLVELPMVGKHNVFNALAAAAVARSFNAITLQDIVHGLQALTPAPRRLEYLTGINGATIIDDSYNANPVATKIALEILAAHQGIKVFVFGDMGELGVDAMQYHQEIGELTSKLHIDLMLTVGDLAKAAQQAFNGNGKHFNNNAALSSYLIKLLQPNTLVLIKGSNNMGMDKIVKAMQQQVNVALNT